MPCLWHVEVPGLGIKSAPQQQQNWILNPLGHQETPHYTFFMHSSVDGHLDYFHILAIVNSVAVNICVHVLFRMTLSVSLDIWMELLDRILVLFLVILRNFHTGFHSGSANLHSHQQCTRVSFSPYLANICYMFFMAVAILTGVIKHLIVLTCISLIINLLSIFSCACWPSICLLWKNGYSSLLPFLNWFFFFYSE